MELFEINKEYQIANYDEKTDDYKFDDEILKTIADMLWYDGCIDII